MAILMFRKLKSSYSICIGGILTSLAVLFQSAPVLLPTIGLVLSPLSTLPVILAAMIDIPIGIMVLFSSALILLAVSPQEAVIMLVATGPLGIVIGSLLFRRRLLATIFISTGTLFFSITLMTYVVGIPAFGSLNESFSGVISFFIYLIFAFIYVCFWAFCVRRLVMSLCKIRLFQYLLSINQTTEEKRSKS